MIARLRRLRGVDALKAWIMESGEDFTVPEFDFV